MTTAQSAFFDSFTVDEAQLMDLIMDDLAEALWAQPPIAAIRNNGGLTGVSMANS
jgi:hypothetical protein